MLDASDTPTVFNNGNNDQTIVRRFGMNFHDKIVIADDYTFPDAGGACAVDSYLISCFDTQVNVMDPSVAPDPADQKSYVV